MEEILNGADLFSKRPDLFPWVVLILFCTILYKERKMVKEYFQARIDYWHSRKKTDALIPELIRSNTETIANNTATIEHNTMVYKNLEADRGEARSLIQQHEKMSAERMQHIQEVVNRIDRTVTSNSVQLGLIEDRTDRKDNS